MDARKPESLNRAVSDDDQLFDRMWRKGTIHPRWIEPVLLQLERILSENGGGPQTVVSLAPGHGTRETWVAVVKNCTGETATWFLRKVFSTSRWCTISSTYSALGIDTLKPIPFDSTTLLYPGISGITLKDYWPETPEKLLQLAVALGAAFVPPLLTELGDRRPANMIVSSAPGGKLRITHIDFDRSLYVSRYSRFINPYGFIKHLLRRLLSPWVVNLDSDTRVIFFEGFIGGILEALLECQRADIRAPEGLMRDYLKEVFPLARIDLPRDQKMLSFAYQQLTYWKRRTSKEIEGRIKTLAQRLF